MEIENIEQKTWKERFSPTLRKFVFFNPLFEFLRGQMNNKY